MAKRSCTNCQSYVPLHVRKCRPCKAITAERRKKKYGYAYVQAHSKYTPEEKKAYHRAYYQANKEKFFEANRRNSRKTPELRLGCTLRQRLGKAVKNSYKVGSAVQDLGCSIAELKSYLEAQFTDGMSWDNYGRKGWHIDHVVPLAHFDLTDREQLLKACHFTNLQPLWAADNLRKGTKTIGSN